VTPKKRKTDADVDETDATPDEPTPTKRRSAKAPPTRQSDLTVRRIVAARRRR
jgi:hypothetical protein